MNQFIEKPKTMRREDGSRKYAFVTFIMMNDSFIHGALMLAHGLRKGNYDADLVCMVTENISKETREALAIMYDYVVEVDEIYIHHKRRQKRQDRPFLFTRFHAFRLGSDGDLGFNYEKIVVLDADVYPLENYDHLFTLNTPAGTVNEKREYCLEYDEEGNYIIPKDVIKTKKWKCIGPMMTYVLMGVKFQNIYVKESKKIQLTWELIVHYWYLPLQLMSLEV